MGCATSQQAVKSQAQTPSPPRELAQDREPGGIRRALQQQGIRIDEALHVRMVLTNIYIVKYQYQGQQGARPHEGAP